MEDVRFYTRGLTVGGPIIRRLWVYMRIEGEFSQRATPYHEHQKWNIENILSGRKAPEYYRGAPLIYWNKIRNHKDAEWLVGCDGWEELKSEVAEYLKKTRSPVDPLDEHAWREDRKFTDKDGHWRLCPIRQLRIMNMRHKSNGITF